MKNLTKQKINGQQGFTLIELVVVIVILGILAVTAAPKFMNLTGDAKASVVEAVKGSLNSAADMAHAKAMVKGQNGVSGAISAAGTTINLAYGYPTAAAIDSLMEIDAATSNAEFILGNTPADTTTYSHAKATEQDTCRAIYKNATSVARPSITAETGGC